MSVNPSIIAEMRRDILAAPRGHKGVIAGRWAVIIGATVQQVYRLVGLDARVRKGEQEQPELRNWTRVVYAMKKRAPAGAGEISTDQAIKLCAGILPPEAQGVPQGTYDRIARSLGLNKKQRRISRYQAARPNLAHHFDASSSKFFYVHKKCGNDYVLRMHRPGQMGYKNKPIPCDRLRPWVYGLTDDHSGRFICRYTAAHGESMADGLLFLRHAWSIMGLPEQLLADQGTLKKGLVSQDLIKRMAVELPQMMPYAKEAHGKIERPWRTLWQRFEKHFFAGDWERSEIILSELNRRLEIFLEDDYNQMPHRFERDITRMQAWRKISLHGGIVAIPENALATAAKRARRKVGADGILNYEGGIYEVQGLHEAWVYVYEGVFEDRLVVEEIETGNKFDVQSFAPLELGQYRAHPDTPHQTAVKEGALLAVQPDGLLYTAKQSADGTVVPMPIRSTARPIADPFDVSTYAGMQEAMDELTGIAGTAIYGEERTAIEGLIKDNGLNKNYVRDLALEIRAELEIRRANAG
ncbi:hypothetical protein EPN18_04485 [bacterium]|nr:MAG: hypothetical protein EPN18_04485 [bacterium]